MSDTARVQRWRERQRQEGKESLTVWLTHEEKLSIEDLARRMRSSPSAVLQAALAASHPEGAPGAIPVTDTEQVRALIQEAVTGSQARLIEDVTGTVTVTLAAQMQVLREEVHAAMRVPAPVPVTQHGVTGTPTRVTASVPDPVAEPVTETPRKRGRRRPSATPRVAMTTRVLEAMPIGEPVANTTLTSGLKLSPRQIAKTLHNLGRQQRAVQRGRGAWVRVA